MMGEHVGKFLIARKTPSAAREIIRAVFSDELSDLEPFYDLRRHCLERGLISLERTTEGLARYHLTDRGRESLKTFEMLVGNPEVSGKSLSLVNY
ncbi:MAG: hypothetical protein ACRDF4_08675 [Rhabdochlamydiaceae bacterium]